MFGPVLRLGVPSPRRGGRGVMEEDKAHDSISIMADHILQVLTSPHQQLGRSGPICPFISEALARNRLYVASSDCEEPRYGDLLAVIEALASEFAVWRRSLSPTDRIYAALVLVFPRLGDPQGCSLIRQVQREAKLLHLKQGLMIGEFYSGCTTPGIHNTAFRPLDAPVTSLAIRSLTLYDAPFMVEHGDYVSEYLKHFGADGERRVSKLQERPPSNGCPLHHSASSILSPILAAAEGSA